MRFLTKVLSTPTTQLAIEQLAVDTLHALADKVVKYLKDNPGTRKDDLERAFDVRTPPTAGMPSVQVLIHNWEPGDVDGRFAKQIKRVEVFIKKFTQSLHELWDNYHGFGKVTKDHILKILEPAEDTLIHELTHAYDDLVSKGRAWDKSSQDLIEKSGYDAYLKSIPEVNARFAQALRKIRSIKLLPDYQTKRGGWDNYRQEFSYAFTGWDALNDKQKQRLLHRLYLEYQSLSDKEREELLISELKSKLWSYGYKGVLDNKFDSRLGKVDFKKEVGKHKEKLEEPLSKAREREDFKSKVAARYRVQAKEVKFDSDELNLLYAMIESGENTYKYLMSPAGDHKWEFAQEENGETDREEWAKQEDLFYLERGNAAHYFSYPKRAKNAWLIHFTNTPPDKIIRSGFKGRDTFGIGLTTQYKDDANPGSLAFAYPIDDVKEFGKYGKYAVVFMVEEALLAYHSGDDEKQAIFDVEGVDRDMMFEVAFDGRDAVLYDNEGEEVYRCVKDRRGKCLSDIIDKWTELA